MAGKRLLVPGAQVSSATTWSRGPGLERAVDPRERIAVTVLDSFVRGVPVGSSRLAGDGLTLLEHDMRRPLPKDLGHFEYVIHAAGIASPTYYRLHPIETMDANIAGLRQLLDRAVERRRAEEQTEGFLFFSSSEIYGDPPAEHIPTPETYRGNVSCTGPRACYDESKRYGETLCVNFARQYGVPVTIARPFNNYGPGLKITDRRVIPDLARDILEGRDVTLLSDGSATTDVLLRLRRGRRLLQGPRPRAARRAVQHRHRGARGQRRRTRRTDRVDSARKLFGYTGEVVHRDERRGRVPRRQPVPTAPVIDKARDELGYEPPSGWTRGSNAGWSGMRRTARNEA